MDFRRVLWLESSAFVATYFISGKLRLIMKATKLFPELAEKLIQKIKFRA